MSPALHNIQVLFVRIPLYLTTYILYYIPCPCIQPYTLSYYLAYECVIITIYSSLS